MAYAFSDYDAVRSVLGTGVKELPDASISLTFYHKRLDLDLKELGGDILTDYEAASLLSTTAAINFVEALDVFATYAFASYVMTGMSQFSLKSITDGKAALSRYAESPVKDVVALISANLFSARQRLSELYATYLGESVTAESPRTLLVLSEPDSDTITTGV